MKLNTEKILNITEKYPDFKEFYDFLLNENKRYSIWLTLKKFKIEIVKKQDYESAAILRELEYQIFKDILIESTWKQILNNEIKMVLVDLSIKKQFKFILDLYDITNEEFNKQYSDVVYLLFDIQNGNWIFSSKSKITFYENLKINVLTNEDIL